MKNIFDNLFGFLNQRMVYQDAPKPSPQEAPEGAKVETGKEKPKDAADAGKKVEGAADAKKAEGAKATEQAAVAWEGLDLTDFGKKTAKALEGITGKVDEVDFDKGMTVTAKVDKADFEKGMTITADAEEAFKPENFNDLREAAEGVLNLSSAVGRKYNRAVNELREAGKAMVGKTPQKLMQEFGPDLMDRYMNLRNEKVYAALDTYRDLGERAREIRENKGDRSQIEALRAQQNQIMDSLANACKALRYETYVATFNPVKAVGMRMGEKRAQIGLNSPEAVAILQEHFPGFDPNEFDFKQGSAGYLASLDNAMSTAGAAIAGTEATPEK